MNTPHKIIIFTVIILPPKNRKAVKNLRNTIIPYSLIKIRVNNPPPYSTLNPDTSSDSPSAKSKGVRFDSAIHSITHENKRGTIATAAQYLVCISFISLILSVLYNKTSAITCKAKHTSYEIVWAIARYPPNKAYFELDPHLVRISPYTEVDIIVRIIKIFKDLDITLFITLSYKPQHSIITIIISIGPIKNIAILGVEAFVVSFVKSFKASAIGCVNPINTSLLGPFR